MARALFLGRLREDVGTTTRSVPVDGGVDFDRFTMLAVEGDARLAQRLGEKDIRVAVNARLIPADVMPRIRPGDEVAFMPVFSGG